jgi:uncharacterized membrane protein YfcA
VELTLPLALAVALGGAAAGFLGALLGIGGGVFLVPFLVIGLGLPMHLAVGVSLITVIGTSTAVSAGSASRHLINLRLGLLLEIATTAGGFLGGLTGSLLPARTLARAFGLVTALIALASLARLDRRNVLPDDADTGRWGDRFVDEETGRPVVYRVKHLPFAIAGSFVAGGLSTLLGIGGGVIKVPMLNTWCGVPLRVAAATSAFTIGITATSGALVYYGLGRILPAFAAAAVMGVRVGSALGLRLGLRAPVRHLKGLMIVVLLAVSALMLLRTP